MSQSDPTPPDDEIPQPIHGQVRHQNVSARITDDVSVGVFSNGVMILTGVHESVLDFAMRMGETQRIVTRVILPNIVARQFGTVLQENMKLYESSFGVMPTIPKLRTTETESKSSASAPGEGPGGSGGYSSGLTSDAPSPEKGHFEKSISKTPQPSIDEIYDDLKLPESVAMGRYANAVMIRHSGTEFCFDFIANFYPRSVVTARVYMSAPHVPPVLASILRSLQPPTPPIGPAGMGPSHN